eukprot:6197781-Amphidinium_carterae.2
MSPCARDARLAFLASSSNCSKHSESQLLLSLLRQTECVPVHAKECPQGACGDNARGTVS